MLIKQNSAKHQRKFLLSCSLSLSVHATLRPELRNRKFHNIVCVRISESSFYFLAIMLAMVEKWVQYLFQAMSAIAIEAQWKRNLVPITQRIARRPRQPKFQRTAESQSLVWARAAKWRGFFSASDDAMTRKVALVRNCGVPNTYALDARKTRWSRIPYCSNRRRRRWSPSLLLPKGLEILQVN